MEPEENERNPYVPTGAGHFATQQGQPEPNRSKPIIPALIGLFTGGAASPYALVLCLEQYLRLGRSEIPWTTHVATVFAMFGTMGWILLTLLFSSQAIDWILGRGAPMYGVLGVCLWCANGVFLIWTLLRMASFQRPSANFRDLDKRDLES